MDNVKSDKIREISENIRNLAGKVKRHNINEGCALAEYAVYSTELEQELSKPSDDKAILEALSGEIQITYKGDLPDGIRDKGGYLFFFTEVSRYQGQEERYKREVEDTHKLADFLLLKLKSVISQDEG